MTAVSPSPVHRRSETRRGSMALAIKRSTADVHRQAEAAVERARPFESRASYAHYLTTLQAFYAALEPRLHAHVLPGVDLASRRKLPMIDADLRVLGVGRGNAAVPRLPRIASAAAAFGVAYVLEGKTLGSRFLLEEARGRLGLDFDSGASFLTGYADRTGAMWNAFRSALEDYVAAHGRRATILAAAHATFDAFIASVDGARA